MPGERALRIHLGTAEAYPHIQRIVVPIPKNTKHSRGLVPKGMWDPKLKRLLFDTYCVDLRVLPGGVWPRSLPRQSESEDLRNQPTSFVLHWCYKHFLLPGIKLFALEAALKSDFAAQT